MSGFYTVLTELWIRLGEIGSIYYVVQRIYFSGEQCVSPLTLNPDLQHLINFY